MSTISIKNLSFAYNGQDLLFDNVSLSLDSQWKLGLLGRNGRGKTTLLNIIQGKLDYSGKINANIDFEYFPQVISDKENLTLYAIQDKFHVEQWELEKEFSQLQLDPKVLWQPFNTLSGGEQTKVLLALAFKNKDSFVLLDEPTNHLDAHTRQQVATYLNNKKQGFIITSHDRDFLNQVIDHTLVIEAQNIRLQQGDYARYEEQKAIEDKSNLAQNEKLKRSISQLKTSAAQKKNWARSA
ncbi:ATP-binding cassette domain-containing protein, partial [Lactobacillus salivarius]|nr:ATP-binding cassette domain-containing protein [Ligilactobacillus salivarius]